MLENNVNILISMILLFDLRWKPPVILLLYVIYALDFAISPGALSSTLKVGDAHISLHQFLGKNVSP